MEQTTPDVGTPLQAAVRPRKTDEERQRERELMKRFRRYRCHECGTHYEAEHTAQLCCPADTVYVCPTCDKQHDTIEKAQDCERGHAGAEASPLEFNRCPVCNTDHGNHESAIECCLWRTMPFADRLQLERLVRYGRVDEAHAILRSH
ncbi:hypothetical protein WI89_00965 [Burkholderia ubonensis]|uniref:hypothetical protein n=1 Tax=Burkholderia ubonensis TaxID=101571 RepID=UPI00075B4B4C|nr:hypothetical protein [Burkholderia ubonensis]KVD71824.1 hypothetical protein WI89_00965 [Burkholderia ubonensis]